MDGVASNNQSGFMGGAQIGYNYQWSNNILLGVETDIQGTNTRGAGRTSTGYLSEEAGTIVNANTIGSTVVQGGLDYLGTVRGRIGYLWNPTLLVYGNGGFAYGGTWGNVAQTAANSTTLTLGGNVFGTSLLRVGGGQQSQLLTGWTAGGGIEWMFMPNWSLKAEALYWDLGRMNVNTISYVSDASSSGWGRTSVNYSGVTARAGINYHFNWVGSAPINAKY